MSNVCRTAEQHVAKAQELLQQAEVNPRSYKLELALGHLDAARTITKMEEAKAAKQAWQRLAQHVQHPGSGTLGIQAPIPRDLSPFG